jgi:hypothetical protein
MQKQLKAKTKHVKTTKYKKSKIAKRFQKNKYNVEVSKTINKNIEKEMAARAVKFDEKLDSIKVDKRDVAKAGGRKPGKKRNN